MCTCYAKFETNLREAIKSQEVKKIKEPCLVKSGYCPDCTEFSGFMAFL